MTSRKSSNETKPGPSSKTGTPAPIGKKNVGF
jgi:hypothetical protein